MIKIIAIIAKNSLLIKFKFELTEKISIKIRVLVLGFIN